MSSKEGAVRKLWGALLALVLFISVGGGTAVAAVPKAKDTTSSATTLTAQLPKARGTVTWWFELGTKKLDRRTPAKRQKAHKRAVAIKAGVKTLKPSTAYRFRLCTRPKGAKKAKCTKPRSFRTTALPVAPVFAVPPAPPTPAASEVPRADDVLPSVAWRTPADGATVAGDVRLEAEGTGTVVFEVDGQRVGEVARAPYAVTWDSTTVADGRHALTAYAGDARATIHVQVANAGPDAPEVDSTSATPLSEAAQFLYTGADAVQQDVATGAIKAESTSVLRGRVTDRAGSALGDVSVTVLDHPELGHTETEPNGEFSMAVNGGGPLTVALTKDGFLPVQRQVSPSWQGYAWIDDVALVALDGAVTAIDDDGGVARGSAVSDDDGTRRATLLFEPGTGATMTLADGTTRALDAYRVRATEYTVGTTGPDAMPGGLPATSAYTYAVEYTLDEALAAGATRVDFDTPVAAYTDNFLGFPTGETVPAGYYDRELARWVPAPSGRVIKVLSESDGKAVLDIDGDGDPAPAGALGIDDAERRRLAELYAPGASLWRVPVTHFTPYDFNWGFGLPPDARSPYALYPEFAKFLDRNCEGCGSVIGTEDQTYGEELELPGVPFSLHYQSARQEGRRDTRRITVQLTGDDALPASIKGVRVEVEVAGRRFTEDVPATPNRTFTLDWDGRDAFGRKLEGAQLVRSRVGYKYEPDYSATRSFAVPGGAVLDANPARNELFLWREEETTVGALGSGSAGLGGWTLDEHHAYDPIGRRLYYGDGTSRSVDGGTLGKDIRTFAGTGESGYDDNELAKNAALNGPAALLALADGAVLIADSENARVRRVRGGRISTIAGTGEPGTGGDGGPATAAELTRPISLAAGPLGEVYVLDEGTARVRRIDADGRIATVAGNGDDPCAACAVTGAGTAWALDQPRAIAAGRDGTLYIAERARILRVTPDGSLSVLAGDGTPGFAGDGGAADAAKLSQRVESLAVGPDGSVYIGDTANRRLRRVTADGVIATVAGGGEEWPDAAGRPGPAVSLDWPTALTAAADGTVRFADGSGFVLALGPDGNVAQIAGAPVPMPSLADARGAAKRAMADPPLPWVTGLAVGPNGDLLVADADFHRVLRLAKALPGFTDEGLSIASEDGTEVYEFSRDGRHLRTVDGLTGRIVYRFVYDEGRLVEVHDAVGDVTRIERTSGGAPTAIVGPHGRRTKLETAGGLLTGVLDAAAREWDFGYAAGGLLTSITNPRGATWRASYDAEGRLTREVDPDGGVQTLTPGAGRTTTLSDAGGGAGTFSAAPVGLDGVLRTASDGASGVSFSGRTHADGSEEMTLPDGTEVATTEGLDPRFGAQAPYVNRQTVETPAGRRMTTRESVFVDLTDGDDPFSVERLFQSATINGKTTDTEYVAATRTETLTTPEGRASSTRYNELGLPVENVAPGRDPIVTGYDDRGRQTSLRQGTREATWTYDADGNVARHVDALGRESTATYDAAGQLVRLVMAGDRTVEYAYDAVGNRTSVTPPGRPAHTTAFSPGGQLLRQEAPAVAGEGPAVTSYEYDDGHQLRTVTRPDGSQITLAYGPGGRLASVTGPGGVRRFGYDAAGRQTLLEGPGDQKLEMGYDGGLPVSLVASGTVPGTVALGYDRDFNLTSSRVGAEPAVTFGYDNDGLLTSAGALALSYDPENGAPVGSRLGDVETSSTFDRGGRLELLTAAGPDGFAFRQEVTRDAGGRITADGARSFAYDAAGRLREVRSGADVLERYAYDTNGNRVSEQRDGGGEVAATFDARDRLVSRGSTTYTYTRNGDLRTRVTPSGTTTYDYNAFGDLTGVTLEDGRRIDYVVDGAGARVGRKLDGAWTQRFVWGGDLGPAAEVDATGDVVTRFVYGLRGHVPEYMVRGGVTYRFVLDRQGSVRRVVDVATGAVVQSLDYDAFGRVVADTAPGFQPFGFGGGLYDPATGLVRFGARDYDADAGRWTSPDPLGFGGGDANLYAYVGNDPVNLIDPVGLFDLMDVSEFAAGALNEITFGASNKIAGIDDIDSDAYRFGRIGGMINPKGILKAGAKRAFGRFGKKSGSQIRRNAKKGKRGERRAGATAPRRRIICPSGKGRYPDIYDEGAKLIGEVKNVNHLSNTAQLRDYVAFARQNNFTFRLIVRKGVYPFSKGTTFSGPLQEVLDEGVQKGYIEVVRTSMVF